MRPLILFPLIPLALLLTQCAKEEGEEVAVERAPQPVEVTTPERATLKETLRLVGSIEPNESAVVRAEIIGILGEILFTDGQSVTAGEVLATVDDRELQAQLQETQARLTLARQNYERNQRLAASNSVAQAEVDSSAAEVGQLEASEQLLQVRLSKTRIVAPFDGTLGSRQLSPGDLIDTTRPLTTLVDDSRLKITFQVPERYYRQVSIGGTLMIDTGDESPSQAKIYFVSSTLDAGTRSAEVKAYLENPPSTLRPGMFAPVDLLLTVHENTLAVPEGAILTSAQGSVLIGIKPGENGSPDTAQFIPVKTDLRELGRVEVLPIVPNSLDENTQIVAAGVGSLILFPDAPVDPRPMQTLPERLGSNLEMPEDRAPKEKASADNNETDTTSAE